jgi:hypothetical protein
VKQLAALEPARLAGAVSALLVLLAAFGLHLTGDQQGAIVGLVSAVVPIIAAEVTRSQVTPVARPEAVAVHTAAAVPQNGASVATPTPNPFLAAVVSAIESPAAQTAVLAAVTSGEVPLETLVDAAITNAKASGVAGLFISAAKGAVETEVNAEFAKYTPADITAYLTKLAVDELTALGG